MIPDIFVPISIQHNTGDTSQGNKPRKGNRRTKIRKEEVKLSLCADMVIC